MNVLKLCNLRWDEQRRDVRPKVIWGVSRDFLQTRKKGLVKNSKFHFSWNLSPSSVSQIENRLSPDALSSGTRRVSYRTRKVWNRLEGLYAICPLPSAGCHEIVPNCPQIDGHPRFPEPLSTTTPVAVSKGERSHRSASPPRDVERVRVHRAHPR